MGHSLGDGVIVLALAGALVDGVLRHRRPPAARASRCLKGPT